MKALHFSPEITDDFVRTHEQYLVPAVYARWAGPVVEIAEIELGQQVLDVACGTGSLALAAGLEAGLAGKVVGLDSSEKMLESARGHSRLVDWQRGDAEAMPFARNRFDRVLCHFALMFITNRVAAIREMLRVCKPCGYVVLASWGPLQKASAYDELIRLLSKFSGAHAARQLALPWELGKPGVMDALLVSSGVNEYECHERVGQACYPSIRAFIEAHLRLAGEFDHLDERTLQALVDAAHVQLRPYLSPGGQLIARLDANIYKVRNV